MKKRKEKQLTIGIDSKLLKDYDKFLKKNYLKKKDAIKEALRLYMSVYDDTRIK